MTKPKGTIVEMTIMDNATADKEIIRALVVDNKLIEARTIERCAQVADKIAKQHSYGNMAEEVWGQGAAKEIAAAIRALKG